MILNQKTIRTAKTEKKVRAGKSHKKAGKIC